MRARVLWTSLLAAAVGCGNNDGGKPSADAFSGDWHGVLSWTPDRGSTQYYSVVLHVLTSGETLELGGLCTEDSGPTGKASSASTFILDQAACDPIPAGCGTVTWRTESGSGATSGNSLSFGLALTLSGCGESDYISAGFTGVRGLAPDAGGPDPGGGNNLAPVASIQSPAAVSPGTVVTLDGSQSYDPEGQPLSFQWTLARPSGSATTLQAASSAQAHFTPDVTGTYTATLTVSDGQLAGTAMASIIAATGSLTLLGFSPLDAEYDRPLDRIVAIATTPDAVHLLDPATLEDRSVALPVTPRAISLSPDGLVAAVGHDAWISYVDLGTMTVLHTWPITADVGDLVVTDPLNVSGRMTRFAYVFPSRDQWVEVHAIDLGNGAETTVNGLVYAGMRARLQPGSFNLFAIDPALSPTQLYRWTFAAGTGDIAPSGESPYWGDYPIGNNIWISDDGSQILSAGGTRFHSSDMTYGGKTSVSPIAWADSSTDAGLWVVQPASLWWDSTTARNDTAYWTYDTVYLASPQRVEYPKFLRAGTAYDLHGRYVFWNRAGNGIVVLAEVDTAAQLISGWTVLLY
jgi:chitinase